MAQASIYRSEEGRAWQRQHHIYESPFYYIDYCLAQTVSLQFWAEIQMVANLDDYIASSVEGLADKLADAQNVLENATTQAEIDEATKTLREARLNARTKADTSALEELIAYAKSLDLSGYTTESAQAVIQNLARAENLITDPEITQEEVNNMVETLQASVDNLVEVNNSTSAEDTTNTAAAMQTGLFAGLLAVSAGLVLMMRRRRTAK